LRKLGVRLKVTKNLDRVYYLAANMRGIGFIKTVFAYVMGDNTRIDINMMEAPQKETS
jgi:hypothetical protein